MMLLSCSGLTRGFDQGPLFQDLRFELYAGDRIGLVGPNGVGKTTLLRLLAGLDQPDQGEVRLHAGARAALLSQQPEYSPDNSLFQEARRALDPLLAAQEELLQVAEALAHAGDAAERKTLAARYDRLNELLRHHNAYNLDHQIEKVLDGLGFQPDDYDRPVHTFSGGQQSRLMLAKLLIAAPDVMLLDEPSNHLDIAATRWLEDYLVEQAGAMIIVSHDRYFLDKVATKIFELYAFRLSSYPGNFQSYWRLRRERYEQELKAWEAQQESIARQEDYIRRVHYGQLHKQAQSRQKALDRLERLERPSMVASPHMHFGAVRRSGDVILQVTALSKTYDRPLFSNLSFALERSRRLGILGPNGSGKTTLLRLLMAEELPDSGEVQRGHQVEFGYYDQHLNCLPSDLPVLRAVWPDQDREWPEQKVRDLLGRFGLTGDQVNQPVADLSGGERSRAALARLVAQGANVLVLDEPTNHLDLWAADALEQALLEFDGTVIVVSHDRYFLNRVVDLLIVLDGEGGVRVVHGNYDTYERMSVRRQGDKEAGRQGDKQVARQGKSVPRSISVSERGEPRPKRKRRFPFRKLEDLETDIVALESRLRELEQCLASPDLYRDGEKVKDTKRAFEETKTRLEQLYEHWQEAMELS